MVEARGVEPLSENATGEETTCLFRSSSGVTGTFTDHAKNGRETRSASLLISPLPPDVGLQASPLCDVLLRPTDKDVGNGNLIRLRMPSVDRHLYVLHTVTGACTPVCLLAANISVEAVTPPSRGGQLLAGFRRENRAWKIRNRYQRSTSTLASAAWKSTTHEVNCS